MKRVKALLRQTIIIIAIVVSFTSCSSEKLLVAAEYEIEEYQKCYNNESFLKWFHKAGYYVIEEDVTWGFYKAMPYSDSDDLYLNIKLEEGIAEYHQEEFLKKKSEDFKHFFEKNGNIISINTEYGFICVLLKNPKHFRGD